MDFERACKQDGMGIEFEYTALGTPRWNGHVKQKFATIFNRVYAMLDSQNVFAFLRNSLWAEAANTATLLENELLTSKRDLSPFEHFWEGKENHSILGAKIQQNVHHHITHNKLR